MLKDRITLLVSVSDGIPFLGFRIFPSTIRLPQKGLARFRRKLYAKELDFHRGEIDGILLSRSVGSMIGHMARADTLVMRQQTGTTFLIGSEHG